MFSNKISEIKKYFADGVHTEVRAQQNKTRSVAIVSGNLTGNSRSETEGVSARVYKNGVYGFSSMAEVSEEAARNVLRAATENAVFLDSRINKNKGALPIIEKKEIFCPTSGIDVEQKMYIDFARELDSYVEAKCKNLTGRGIFVRADSMDKYIEVSDGCSGHSYIPRSYIYLRMTAETKDGIPVERFIPIGGFGTFDKFFTTPDALFSKVDDLYEKIMLKREGIYPEAGVKTCILGGELSGMLAHEAVGHTVEADLVLGGSVAAHNLNKRVASDLVTMIDYAHTANGEEAPLPVYMDDEGVPCEDQVLIKDGILVGYMNNRESAERFGMKPMGNARAYSFSDEPLIRMRNTAIAPGKSTIEEMIASVDDGYYFTDTNNGQADTTGEFMFGVCMGYEIKNGKLARPLLDTTISGVAFEMLQTVDMVSDTMEWSSSGYCGKKQPMPVGIGGAAVRCKVTIGGR